MNKFDKKQLILPLWPKILPPDLKTSVHFFFVHPLDNPVEDHVFTKFHTQQNIFHKSPENLVKTNLDFLILNELYDQN